MAEPPRVVVFEDLQPWQLALAGLYRLRGFLVIYVVVSSRLSPTRIFQWMKRRGMFHQVNRQQSLYMRLYKAADPAFDAVERSYPQWQRTQLVQQIVRLYGSPDVHLAFKKVVLGEFELHYRYRLFVEALHHILPDARAIIIIPASSGYPTLLGSLFGMVPRDGVDPNLPVHIRLPHWWPLVVIGRRTIFRFQTFLLATRSLLRTGLRLARGNDKSEPLNYPFAVAIVSPLREFANDIRSVDFLLDHLRIRRDNTLFVPISRLSQANIAAARDRGLALAILARRPSVRQAFSLLWHQLRVIGQLFTAPAWMTRAAAHLVEDYLRWTSFVQAYRVGEFVTYADFGYPHVGRNIVLRENGVRTWYYVDSHNTGDGFFAREDGRPYRSVHWGYLYYDFIVSWGNRHIDFFKQHRQVVGQYVAVGCLWAEHVRQLRDGSMKTTLRQQLFSGGYSPGTKVLAVFDTSYVNGTVADYRDGVRFLRDLQHLSRDLPNVLIVLKEKKPRRLLGYNPLYSDWETFGMERTLDELGNSRRFLLPGYRMSVAEILAQADLVISFPYTSTCIEALAAGIPSFFYDPTGKFRGTINARIPGLVAHGYEELLNMTARLLSDGFRAEFDELVNFHVRSHFDPYLDGMAITRFRNLLLGVGKRDASRPDPKVAD